MSAIVSATIEAHQLCTRSNATTQSAWCTCSLELPSFADRESHHQDHVHKEIEAAVRRACAAEIRAVASDPDALRPLSSTATRKTDFANDFEWAAIAIEQPIGGVL